jgi:hypothetical protein
MTKKEPVVTPQLKMEVYHEDLYKGEWKAKVVGIRENEVELYCDMSGGTHGTHGASWFPLSGLFRKRKVCEQHEKFGTCTLPNVHCQYPDCEEYV